MSVPAGRPLTVSTNVAVVSDATTLLSAVVGLAESDHTTPRSRIGEFPSDAIVAPRRAVPEATPADVGAMRVGADVASAMEAVSTRFVSIVTVNGLSVS